MNFNRFLSATALTTSIALASTAHAGTIQPDSTTAAAAAAIPAQTSTSAEPQTGITPETVGVEDDQDPRGNDVVVTGTRLNNRPTVDSPVPITTVSATELLSRGSVAIGDALNQLPQLRATFGQSNSTRFIGTSGINALDLRGLGTARTLVLLDGRRIITATPGVNRPDVNTIPNDLLERVDVLTGGNSSIYGSDAVSGVVNFILKKDLEGFRVRAQSGISSRGDAPSYFISGTAGHNFGGGRGNIAVSAEYARSDVLYYTERDGQTGAYSGRSQFQAVQNTGPQLNPSNGVIRSGAEPATGDGVFDTSFLRGIRNNSISEGGLFAASCPTTAATGETAAQFAARRARACSGLPDPSSTNATAQFGSTFVFQPDGSLIRNPCITDYRPFGSANCQGGLGSTLRLTGMLQPRLDRVDINVLTHYEVSPAFDPFVQAQFVRVKSLQEGQPTFFNNTFSINNPFLTDAARATLLGVLAPGTTTFTAQRFNVDFGGRGENHKRQTFQIVGGARGTFNDDWKYEVSVNYGNLYTYYETAGNLIRSRYANSLNAVRNAAGQIVCGINADASTANDDPACVPVNLFGQGQVSAAALNYFGYTSSRVQKADLFNAVASVSGDLSQLFELPGGPIAFSIGGEYRFEKASAYYDSLTSSSACGTAGCTFLNIIPDFRPPNLKVKEAFGEVSIPLLKDIPLIQELTVSGAGRVSDYNLGNTGTVWSWNVNAVWAPVRDLRLRVNYARAVRAPTQSDLYSPLTQTFLNTLVDPCGQQNINNNPNRVRNCAAAGVPTTQTFNGVTEPFTNRPGGGIVGFNGANENLEAEKSNSLTAGAVFQPSFLPGVSLTVDYYRIKIRDAIFSLLPQTIINQCYDSATGIDNPFCAAIFRNPNGTFQGQSNVQNGGTTVSFPTTGTSFISGPFNYARQITSGVDIDLLYRTRFANGTGLVLRGIASRTLKRNNFTDITDPTFAQRQLGTLGDPAWAGQFSANIDSGIINFGYRMRYIGKQTINVYENQYSFQGRPPLNPDIYPVKRYPDITYHDLRLDLNLKNSPFKFYTGVDNVLDRLPPFDLLGVESGSTYNVTGRFFYTGIELKF